ncbi:hypothetical protein EOD39_7976 [Acipenser ruthenus]|uniref:Uncharacterized protein n=1 Tax=Acipenser ruthenus TaxID=7906 RepID=A0A662YYI4_ACIRT|nr:hypothetical protein EOD39_7976 [Acipenser ruthenus]
MKDAWKKLQETDGVPKTTRKPFDLEDINTLLLEYHEGMDPLEEDQPDEKQMMEEGRDEVEEAVRDEPQPSTSTVKSNNTQQWALASTSGISWEGLHYLHKTNIWHSGVHSLELLR